MFHLSFEWQDAGESCLQIVGVQPVLGVVFSECNVGVIVAGLRGSSMRCGLLVLPAEGFGDLLGEGEGVEGFEEDSVTPRLAKRR